MPIPAVLGAALATGAFSVGGQIISGIQRRKQFSRQRRFNREMAEYEFRKNKEMADLAWKRDKAFWRMQNKYNSPAAQMARFEEAGLNPNLIYGQGTPGNAQAMVSYNAPSFNAPRQPVDKRPIVDTSDLAQRALDIVQSVHATEQMKLNAEKTAWAVATEEARSILKFQESKFNAYELGEIQSDPGSYKESIKAKWAKRISEAYIKEYQGKVEKLKSEALKGGIKAAAALAKRYNLDDLFKTLMQMIGE